MMDPSDKRSPQLVARRNATVNVLPDEAWMTAGEAVAWVAFRRALPYRDWPEHDYALDAPEIVSAIQSLSKQAATGNLFIYGRKLPPKNKGLQGGEYERVPLDEFIDGSTIDPSGWIKWGSANDTDTRRNYSDIRMPTYDIECLFPPRHVPREGELPIPHANPEASVQRQYDHEIIKAEFTGRLVVWRRKGGTDSPPTVQEIEAELEDRFPGQCRRWQARELAKLWPKESRKQGRRSSR